MITDDQGWLEAIGDAHKTEDRGTGQRFPGCMDCVRLLPQITPAALGSEIPPRYSTQAMGGPMGIG